MSAFVDTTISQQDENDPVDSFPTSAFVDTIKLEGILNQYRVDHYNETAYDESILCKYNDCQVLLFRSTHQMMRSNDIHFSHGNTYDDAYCDNCNNLDTSDQFGKDIDAQVVRNNNLFSDYDDNTNHLLYHLDSINLMPDPYSNKQWNQPNHHDYLERDLYGTLKHVSNRKTYYGEQRLKLYIINYVVCDSSTSSGSRRRSYRSRIKKEKQKKRHKPKGKKIKRKDLPQDENRMLSLIDPTEKTACLKQELQQSKCRDLLFSNQELKRAHPNECCTMKTTRCYAMKRKDGVCPDPEVKFYHKGAYQQYLVKQVSERDYVWGDNKSMINSPTVPEDKSHKRHNILSFPYVRSMLSRGYLHMQPIASKWTDNLTKHWSYQGSYHELIYPVFHHAGNTAAMFPDETLEVDASIAKGTIFGILGSEKGYHSQ